MMTVRKEITGESLEDIVLKICDITDCGECPEKDYRGLCCMYEGCTAEEEFLQEFIRRMGYEFVDVDSNAEI